MGLENILKKYMQTGFVYSGPKSAIEAMKRISMLLTRKENREIESLCLSRQVKRADAVNNLFQNIVQYLVIWSGKRY